MYLVLICSGLATAWEGSQKEKEMIMSQEGSSFQFKNHIKLGRRKREGLDFGFVVFKAW